MVNKLSVFFKNNCVHHLKFTVPTLIKTVSLISYLSIMQPYCCSQEGQVIEVLLYLHIVSPLLDNALILIMDIISNCTIVLPLS